MVNDPLADGQAHTYTLLVHVSCLLQLAKHTEELVHIFRFNTAAAINYPYFQKLILFIVLGLYRDMLLVAEFEGILCQVDEHLLQSNMISDKFNWQVAIDCYETKLRLLHLGSLLKHACDKVEGSSWVKSFLSSDEPVLINHLHIEDIIDEAEEQIYLRDQHKNHLLYCFIQDARE